MKRIDIVKSLPFETNLTNILNDAKRSFDSLWKSADTDAKLGKSNDFKYVKKLGEGAFGKVLLAYHKPTRHFYAAKLMRKHDLVVKNQVRQVYNEKRILFCNNFNFLMNLFCYYKDNSTVYLMMRCMEGGEMFVHLKRMGHFPETLARFYAIQVIMGLLYLHGNDLIYRDMKPENLLLDNRGYVRITDFGFSKKIKSHTWTFCGTLDYMAPEMVLNKGVNLAVDWWGVGILIFEMCAGYAPFSQEGEEHIFGNIANGVYSIPEHFSGPVEDIVERFLQANPEARLGMSSNQLRDICNHPWFVDVDWTAIYEQKMSPNFVPECQSITALTAMIKKPESSFESELNCNSTEEYPDLFAEF